MPTIIAIIQAHMSSTRLPGKIMKPLCGEPALFRMIERVRQSRLLDDIIIATSTLPCDDIIVQRCQDWKVRTFRGSDSDVLARFYGAARAYPADIYVRMTSDCPLITPAEIDGNIRFFLDHNYRYVSDIIGHRTYPMGISAEVFTAELLKEAAENATENYEHEHVTPYMYWKQKSIGANPYKAECGDIRITLDTQEDYEVISAVYEALYTPGNTFDLDEILAFLNAHPEIKKINRMVVQKNEHRQYENKQS